MITLDMVKMFCADKNDIHRYLRAPWSRDGYTYASNGCIGVCVDRIAEVPENDKAPNMQRLLDNIKRPEQWFPIPNIPTIRDDGTGETECPTCGRDMACPACDGRKRVPIDVGEACFDAKYLALLRGLPNCEIGPTSWNTLALFRFDGGIGVLMPLLKA